MSIPATGLSLPVVSPPSPQAVPRLRRPRATLLAALGLGVCAEVLFDGPALGLSFPLFALLLLGALLALGGREGWQRARPNAWLLVPWLFFSGMVFVRASPLLTSLNVLASGLLLLLLVHFWAAGRVERLGLGDYVSTVLGGAWQAMFLPPAVVRSEVERIPLRGQLPKLLPVARGALLSLPILILFTALLSSADEVFSVAVDRGFSFVWNVFSVDTLARGVFAAGSAFGVLGLLAHALRRRREREAGVLEAAPAVGRLGFIESLTLLGAVDVLFLAFVSLQLAFMWGGARLPSGLTYSEYARRGFFELLAVSVMTLGLSLVLERWTRLNGAGQVTAFRAACSAMVGLVLVLLASAVQRMALYESAYGYTHLRVYTHVFMLALAGVLVWRVVTLWWRPERFAMGAFAGALVGLAALNVLNPDAFIARANLARSTEGTSWDASYLAWSLSEDAAPEMAAHLAQVPDSVFSPELHGMFCRFPERDQGGWPAFHLARHRAAALTPPGSCPER
ncbi:hypothetical protein D187_003500 [Cystobacter fuscus DSM 2262]|uniref:Uncharacterized protein n=1 Tax=Cystobacter fuscus (strain ATCC 25194 / DSM 2262 / NBRC 100088 / M29) TaxID=1242864 RepID=S9P2U3_CYSF2|nr:DUF4173 domain-containing protein [Cystobacter fuscus]EPX58785.1 hypothetical protein D187_003500 [Cystobacter fuscus DSM 2262]